MYGLDSSPDEMNSSRVENKESKIAFLSRLILHMEKEVGVSIRMKPKKVVAGTEADNMRYFFQLFALAATFKQEMASWDGQDVECTSISGTSNIRSTDVKASPDTLKDQK